MKTSDTLAGIAAGDIYGTIVQKPFYDWPGNHHPHGRISSRRQNSIGRRENFIPSQAVTKDNVADYLAVQRNQLLQTQAGTP